MIRNESSNLASCDESAVPPQVRWSAGAWFLAVAVLAVVLYFYCLHVSYPTTSGKSVIGWMWLACNEKNDFIHGRIIPLAFVILSWIGWRKARHEERRPASWGLWLVGFGLLLYVTSVRAVQPRLALVGLPFLIVGALVQVQGWAYARHFVFPAFFWYFGIHVPGLQQATALLQVVVTKVCFQAGIWMGMPLINDGNTISAVGPDAWDFDIAEGCSGIRSLMALAMVAALYANYTQKELWKKAVLFGSALPLALLGNLGRIFTILVLAHFGFKEFAARTYHDWAGLLIFYPISLSGLFLFDRLLNFRSRRSRRIVRKQVGAGEGGIERA